MGEKIINYHCNSITHQQY